VLPENFGELCKYSAYETRYWVKATFLSLKLIFTRKVSSEEVSGPVGVAKSMNDTFNEAKKSSTIDLFLNWLNYIVLLSANLGVMNLIPIPGLDGGRFLFLLIEAITRKPVPKEKENIVTLIGFVIVMALMIVILFNDIKNVFF
jgi:regulator of sigma E protease